ncbi:MAG TPA: radical SAM family heme chaperone HemW [Pyrinomonadaceae bacterium]|nr:radical SAM family heme chaperone HemW [Pyrinomonadaceae bacterium]
MLNAGVYIHIPFCRARCSYCDFATGMYAQESAARYVDSLTHEISTWSELSEPEPVDTIYFGGGTPSLLTARQIEVVLNAVHARFSIDPGVEVTIEINPASVSDADSHEAELPAQKLLDFRRLGINRASFGAQTFDDRELKLLGRTHDAAAIADTFEQLRRAGFENINFDLIAGLPNQTLAGWERNLEQALRLRPEHLSLYLLDVHEGTPLADQISRGMRPRPDEDLAAEMYRVMIERVCAAGYQHYEISNFCLPGFASRHNTKYWIGAPYYGFGNSAHSYDGARLRWANERDAARYVHVIDSGESPVVERTVLNEDDARSESVFLGLRLMSGIDLQNYRERFGRDLREQYDGELGRLCEAGLIELDRNSLRLTTRGALLSNEVFSLLA